MANNLSCTNEGCCNSEGAVGGNPDCLRCLRTKLRALSVVVFLRDENGWWLDSYQGEKPSDAAEAEFQYMLKAGVPDAILTYGQGFCLNNDREIVSAFPKSPGVFQGHAVIASQIRRGKTFGVRLAWRDQSEPFSSADIAALQCEGNCPEGCVH